MTPNDVTNLVINAALKVHTALGAGLLEEAYKVCLKYELTKRNLQVLSEVAMPIVYDGVSLDTGYRIDLILSPIC
jgi:GxxExxY protein